jgi:hypothetical protein
MKLFCGINHLGASVGEVAPPASAQGLPVDAVYGVDLVTDKAWGCSQTQINRQRGALDVARPRDRRIETGLMRFGPIPGNDEDCGCDRDPTKPGGGKSYREVPHHANEHLSQSRVQSPPARQATSFHRSIGVGEGLDDIS